MATGMLLHSAEHWHAQLFELEHSHAILQFLQVRSSLMLAWLSSIFSAMMVFSSSIRRVLGALIFMRHASLK